MQMMRDGLRGMGYMVYWFMCYVVGFSILGPLLPFSLLVALSILMVIYLLSRAATGDDNALFS